MDLDLEAPPRKAQAVEVEDVSSPQKKTAGVLTLEDIRGLLDAQSKVMRETQKEDIGQAVQNAVARSEKRTLGALDDIRKGFLKQTEETRREMAAVAQEQRLLREQQQDILVRVAKLEAKPASAGSTTASEGAGRKPALVFGGWPATAKRNIVLRELKGILDDVGAGEMLDEAPWTPGPRRGVALSSFRQREGEDFEDMKARMLEITALVNKASIPTESTLDGCPVWAAVSRDRGDRLISSHASKLRRLLHTMKVSVDDTDADYKEGSLWMADQLLGSAKLDPPQGVEVMQGKVEGSWMAPSVVAATTGRNEGQVRETWKKIIEN